MFMRTRNYYSVPLVIANAHKRENYLGTLLHFMRAINHSIFQFVITNVLLTYTLAKRFLSFVKNA